MTAPSSSRLTAGAENSLERRGVTRLAIRKVSGRATPRATLPLYAVTSCHLLSFVTKFSNVLGFLGSNSKGLNRGTQVSSLIAAFGSAGLRQPIGPLSPTLVYMRNQCRGRK